MPEKRPFYGWKLVAVLFSLIFFNMGFPYCGGSVINGYMIRQIPMSRGTLGLGFTLINLFVGIASVLAATSIVKYGVRATFSTLFAVATARAGHDCERPGNEVGAPIQVLRGSPV